MKILVTGGTVFVSKYIAQYFKKDHEVYVLNRNTRKQLDGVHLIEADRNHLGTRLKRYAFDVVLDVCAYTGKDVKNLLDALGDVVKDYILISSSAVYPESNVQPFTEEQEVGENAIWGRYGTNKIDAEKELLSRMPHAYVIRPPYLYGPMQNVYREPFVFECALANRAFYIPKDGSMPLQFFHVEDLCRVIAKILELHPKCHILNVGNEETVSIHEFVRRCYKVVGKECKMVPVYHHENSRDYFSFYDYAYRLDVTKQKELIGETKDLEIGLRESYLWYCAYPEDVNRKDFIAYIDAHPELGK